MTDIVKVGPMRKLPYAIWAWKLFDHLPTSTNAQDPLYSFWHPTARKSLSLAQNYGTYRCYTPGRPSLESPKGLGFFCYHSFADYLFQQHGHCTSHYMRKHRTHTLKQNGHLWLIAIPKGTPVRTCWDTFMERSALLTHALVPLVPLRGFYSLHKVSLWVKHHWSQAEAHIPSYPELIRKQEASKCAR